MGRLLPELLDADQAVYRTLGIGYGALGIFLFGYGAVRQRTVERHLRAGGFVPLPVWVVATLGIAGLALGVATVATLLDRRLDRRRRTSGGDVPRHRGEHPLRPVRFGTRHRLDIGRRQPRQRLASVPDATLPSASFRNTTFDNRGIGATTCDRPMPWTTEDFARDAAELIEAVCEPPVALVGLSFGSAIAQQVCIDRPDLVRCAVVMGTGAWCTAWGWDFQEAEIEFRKAGGRLDGLMGATHYAAMLYPARVLGDRELWPRLREQLLAWMDSGENEASLIPQWDASLRFDQRAALPELHRAHARGRVHRGRAGAPQDGLEVAELAGNAEYHLFEAMGHGSIYGHAHETLNPFIEA